jgi:riboflavin kinase/FMN adenylyltransferase
LEFFKQLDSFPAHLRGGAVTIGNFDGVHAGHAALVTRLRSCADAVNGPSIVFTFDPHPVRLLRPDKAPPPLTWAERKAELLGELGVDAMIAYPTEETLLQLSPEDFFRRIIVDHLQAKALVEGPNFYFGRDRQGDINTLRQLCGQHHVQLEIVAPGNFEGELVSSSRVREALQQGDVETAAKMLTRPYRLRGMVTHGAARGSRIGFPTANLSAVDTLIPRLGVYAGRVLFAGNRYAAAIHLGPNPTFAEDAVKLEIHLLDFQGNLYGQPLEVDFIARLRDIHPFANVDALKQQLQLDVLRTREVVG